MILGAKVDSNARSIIERGQDMQTPIMESKRIILRPLCVEDAIQSEYFVGYDVNIRCTK